MHPGKGVHASSDGLLGSDFSQLGFLNDLDDFIDDFGEGFSVRLGAGVLIAPNYLGDDSYGARFYPKININWRDRVELNNTQLRVALFHTETIRAGAQLRYQFGRGADKRPDLVGLDPIGDAVELGGYLEWHPGLFAVGAAFGKDVAGGHGGTLVAVWAGSRIEIVENWVAAAGARATWASGRYVNSYFGITAMESALSGLPVFDAGSGLRDISTRLSVLYTGFGSWRVVGSFVYTRLLDDSADNPLVRERGSANQLVGLLSLQYSF
ncbi:MAG: MipA/OmpV family protein [Alphaproteobacteria bacterium]